MNSLSVRAVIFFAGGFFFALDRVLKFLSQTLWQEKKLFNNFFGWVPYENTGIAFGLKLPNFIIIICSIIFIAFILKHFFTKADRVLQEGYFLMIIGAISNLIDRLFFQYTADYLLVFTSLFNIADILIIIGAALAIFSIFDSNKKTSS